MITLCIMLILDILYQEVNDYWQVLFFFEMFLYEDGQSFFIMAGFIYVAALILFPFFKKYIGGADLKLIIILTFFYGITVFNILLIASLLAIMYSYLIKKRIVPFIPFLAIGVYYVNL